MLARIRKAQDKDSGFTLIELLVVMIIIGILAAIAIPAFLSQKNKAKGSSAKSDVANIGRELSAYFVDNGPFATAGVAVSTGTGTTASQWALATTTITGKLSPGNKAAGNVKNENDFCVAVWNTDVEGTTDPGAGAPGNGSVFKYQPTGGVSKGNCP